MLPTFADPKTDFVFKRIFGAEAHKDLLIALLNHLLELEGDHLIRAVEHLALEQHVAVPELKLSIVDVKCTDASGRRFVVEMQVLKVEGFEKRVVYNASKAYVMQLRSADQYPALCDVVGVTICNFTLWPDKDASGHDKVPMLSRWRMQEQHGGEKGLSQVQYAFLELPKYAGGDAPRTLVEKWAYFFREARNLDVVPPALADGPFREALEVTRKTAFTPDEWELYERAKMAEQDARGALVVARDEGHQSGLAEGKAEGKAEGRAEGLAEGEARGLAEGEARGLAEGELKGKRAALLRLLARAKLAVTDSDLARIQACSEAETLDRWLENVLGASSVEEVLT